MWSDTGSYIFESKGDVVRSINLDTSNFEGPVKASRTLEASVMKLPPKHYNEQTKNSPKKY